MMSFMAGTKRPRVDTPREMTVNGTDPAVAVVAMRDFGHTWSEEEWSCNLRHTATSRATLLDMRSTLTTSRITPDQITVRLFEAWPAVQQLQDWSDHWIESKFARLKGSTCSIEGVNRAD